MICFLSEKEDPKATVTKEKIFFVSVPDKSSNDEIKMIVSQKAKLFAEKLEINRVFLHTGKDTILYDFTI